MVLVVLCGICCIPASASAAAVHGCHVPLERFGPRNDPGMNIAHMSVRNMACGSALLTIDNSWQLRNGDLSSRSFYCYKLKTYRSFGTVLGAIVRCVSSRRAFRFTWFT